MFHLEREGRFPLDFQQGQIPGPAFLLWREIAEARDWARLMALPATVENQVVLWAVCNLPTWQEQCEAVNRRLQQALLNKG